MPRLICAFPGRTVIFVGFVMGWLISRIIYTSWDWGESETQLWKTSVAIKPFLKAQFHKKRKKAGISEAQAKLYNILINVINNMQNFEVQRTIGSK